MEWLGILRRLIQRLTRPAVIAAKRPAAPTAARGNPADFAQLDNQAPLKDAPAKHSFVRREAILNRAKKVAGYEFTLMTRLKARLQRRGGTAMHAYDAALLMRLALHNVNSLLGARLAFVSLSAESMDNEAIARLPRDNTVLTFEITNQTHDWPSLAAGFARLKAMGFRHGLHIADATDLDCPLLPQLEFLQIDVSAFDGIDLRALARKLKQLRPDGHPPLLVAREVQSDDDYQHCYKCGFDLFQGPFISSHVSLRPTHDAINRMTVLPILGMVRSGQTYAAIAEHLRNEPVLSYKLLRYLNCAALGLQRRIESLTEALVFLGRDKFYRWTSLLLFDFENPGYKERLLSERALTRGRTLELLAGHGRIPNLPEQLFLIGLFSLLEQALGRPLHELVTRAALPEVVHGTLLGEPGPCTDALALVVLAEANGGTDPAPLAHALDVCGIDDHDYAPTAARALVWADEILGAGQVATGAGHVTQIDQ
jgi:c-di-GMP phosphodiesterase